jgi:hypothetical protein
VTRRDGADLSLVRAAHTLPLIAGGWLLFAGQVLGHGDAPRAVPVAVTLGLLLSAVSLLQLAKGPQHAPSVLLVWIGVALVAAPVLLRYGYIDRIAGAYVSQIVSGVVALAVGLWSSKVTTPKDVPNPRPPRQPP